MTMEFPQIGIQCTKKKDIEANLEKRKKINVNPFLQEVNMSEIDLNVVKLCFQVKRIKIELIYFNHYFSGIH